MSWQVDLLADGRVVHTRYMGRLSAEDLQAACRATMESSREADTNLFLTDCRGLAGGYTLADLFYLIDFLVAEGLDPNVAREAVIGDDTPDMVEKMEFWENAMVNRGFECRRFDGLDAAVAWLVD